MKYNNKNAAIDWGDLTGVVCGDYEQPIHRPPDFIGIGAQKSATTWLWTQLHRSPSVAMPPIKELHYFDRQLPASPFPSANALTRLSDNTWKNQICDALRHAVESDTKVAYANLCITTLQIGMTLGTASFLGLLLLIKLPVKLHLGMQFVMTKAFSTWPL